MKYAVLSACLSALVLQTSAAMAADYSSVSKQRLDNPEDANWLMYRRTYDGWGYSPLDQITPENVKSLRPVWSYSTGVREGHQAPPLVNDGKMFVSTPENQVLALDAASGDLLWRYVRELPDDLLQLHPTNRGVALFGDTVYLATVDAFLVALDAKTGAVLWEREVEDYLSGYYMTMSPLIAEGNVMVGVSGGEFGIRGFVAAFDAKTGEPTWKTYTIPGPGEPGNETWPGETWKTGGVPVWLTGNYDPQTKIAYWGTGNGGPWVGATRAGDNLHATSVIALDVTTGKLVAHHQYHWNDSWDWDEVSPPLLIDVKRDGKTIKGLVHAGRNGYLWLLDRAAETIRFVDAKPFVNQNVFTSIDPKTGRPTYDESKKPVVGKRIDFCPSLWGGKNWPPSAYNPKTRLLYIPANENLCSAISASPASYRPGELYMGATLSDLKVYPKSPDVDHIGELQAWDLDTGERKWTAKFPQQLWAPVLTTGGGLVFAGGTNDRFFRAFDATTGEILWQQRTNSGVTGVPTSFAVNGVQYIAVQSGWGVDAERGQAMLNASMGTTISVPQGGVLWVFALASE
ncbi:MAG: methanol/ethanol family PQQ-dependent dehydrogenase [Proteobacteria bacterium]|nr:methanol/ethanol family PQQ-dependent dehydrogenase [Pseudomonadota bacterium]